MIKRRVKRRYHSIYGSWKFIISAIRGDVMILSTLVAHKATYACGVLVCQPNVTLILTSKTEVSPDEGQANAGLALDDATLQSQSR